MSIILVGDIHCKEKMPFKQASLNFLQWLLNNHQNDTIIQGGDFFDSSSHHHSFINDIIKILSKFKDFRIISGNHDQSVRLGNILLPLQNYSDITIYTDVAEIEIDNIKLLILPFKNSYKDYENLKIKDYEFDYSISHFTPIQEAFGNEGIELKFKVNVCHIWNHIHRYREFLDNFGNKCLIAGVVFNTRYGEQGWENNIYQIGKNNYNKIKVPQYFIFEDLEYGEQPKNKNNILNIKNAPSIQSVYDMYKDYYIRDEGISFKQDTNINMNEINFDMYDLTKEFMTYSKQPDINISEDVKNTCIKYLKEVS